MIHHRPNNKSHSQPDSKQHLQYSLTLFTTILVATLLVASSHFAGALQCSCHDCDETRCDINATDGFCYKYVEKKFDSDKKYYFLEYQFGCLSGGDSLSSKQCSTKFSELTPRSISCCKDFDFCNAILSEPVGAIWNTEDERIGVGYQLLFCLLCIGFISTITLLTYIKSSFRSSKDDDSIKKSLAPSEASDQSIIKIDDERSHPRHIILNVNESTPTTTDSYSTSDYIKKSHHEDEEETAEFTSGVGDSMLVERTIAREVAAGPMQLVGEGRFGRVYKARYHDEDVAVKSFSTVEAAAWQREILVYVECVVKHQNILTYITSETFCHNNSIEIWMIMEYCPLGSLYDFLNKQEVTLNVNQAARILFALISGLNYLHEDYGFANTKHKLRIAHRDIKSKNILMKTPDTCCLADFGHAAVQTSRDAMNFGRYTQKDDLRVGTIRYMAPEILKPVRDFKHNFFLPFAKADIYQFGLVAWEVLQKTSFPPYRPDPSYRLPYDEQVPPDPKFEDMIRVVCDQQYRPALQECWKESKILGGLSDIIDYCWKPDANSRLDTLAVKLKIRELCKEYICDEIDKGLTYL